MFYIKHCFVYKFLCSWKLYSRQYSWRHTSVERETFRSYFACHSENLDKRFTLCDYVCIIVFVSIFVADTKIISGYNFVAASSAAA